MHLKYVQPFLIVWSKVVVFSFFTKIIEVHNKGLEEWVTHISNITKACDRMIYKRHIMDIVGFPPILLDTNILSRYIPQSLVVN